MVPEEDLLVDIHSHMAYDVPVDMVVVPSESNQEAAHRSLAEGTDSVTSSQVDQEVLEVLRHNLEEEGLGSVPGEVIQACVLSSVNDQPC